MQKQIVHVTMKDMGKNRLKLQFNEVFVSYSQAGEQCPPARQIQLLNIIFVHTNMKGVEKETSPSINLYDAI